MGFKTKLKLLIGASLLAFTTWGAISVAQGYGRKVEPAPIVKPAEKRTEARTHNPARSNLEETVSSSDIPEREEPVNQPASQLSYSSQDYDEMRNILYAEAANQPRENRRLIARTILNRVESDDYPDSVHGVIYEKNAFSCIKDRKNKNWRQAIGKLKRNEYEEGVFERCQEDAMDVLEGKRENIPRENEIIAYHDISLTIGQLRGDLKRAPKAKEKYWRGVEEVYRNGRLIFYAPRANSSE